MDRIELADFLRRRRAELTPADVGLAAGPRRRTPGLRREEVAQLAGMSADYYSRLEQARGPRPSRQILAAMARALRLTDDGRDQLFRLVGEPPGDRRCEGHVRPGLLRILDRLDDIPAQVVSDIGDVLARNALAAALFGDASDRPAAERNVIVQYFTDPAARELLPPEDRLEQARAHVADLRAVLAARSDDAQATALVARLRSASPEFAALWASHEVAPRRRATQRFHHRIVGTMELDREVLLSDEGDQRLILHTARPGSESYERLRLLRVVGIEDFAGSVG
ncbi:helix-turn-helix transcriptional regulator [Streptantibioticus ferralitis]|uniref:Helix-turn-helix transcriptional regulator n=1 Tax=Streptantibioticus ferralitis TaxID=236510 RepID=A0ABT5Z5S2_9ACTN|nr:helix-turn-helix transcriptional regulator [Streptantibioticus ferralitis]MDF2259180.1 helix-turn-helix transcriptional regulator [Streptantibioticus ferralitis]